MARRIRQLGRALLYTLPLVVVGVLLVWPQPPSEAATYANPFWGNTSLSPECACANCPCEGPPEWSPEGVNLRTREFVWDHFLFRVPGMVEDHAFSIRWRSTIDGETDMGQRMLPSWLITAEKEILDEENPSGDGGHQVLIRRSSGRIDMYGWDGSDYAAESCNVHDVLTTDVSGNYVLTNPWNNYWLFDSAGMPDKHVDRNGNELDYTCSDFKVSEIEDDRGGTYSFTHNQDGYVSSIEDPAEREWTFTYTTAGDLETITTPATADQANGIVITLDYDVSQRLISVEDGRENVILEVDYDGSSNLVDAVTLDGDDVTFDAESGYNVRTNRLGHVQRFHFTGANLTQQDWWINSQAEYENLYRFNGNTLINRVYPRGNRVDFTRDNDDNLTEKRYRTADTDTNDSSDLVTPGPTVRPRRRTTPTQRATSSALGRARSLDLA